jgi:hypothetical protein
MPKTNNVWQKQAEMLGAVRWGEAVFPKENQQSPGI